MFRTLLDPKPSVHKISHDSQILTMGSCFADSIGDNLLRSKFNVLSNPFGVVYNPIAMFKQLDYCLHQLLPGESTYVRHQDIFYNYDYHSDFSALDQQELQIKIEGSIKTVAKALEQSNWLIMTFGTAVAYTRKDNESMVANCHKIPAQNFIRTFVSQKQIIHSFEETSSKLLEKNPSLRILLTVSPVRHLKETFQGNSVSKSILRLVCDTLQNQYDHVEYFPAYEILLDDLRDYRFYAEDMVHPNIVGEKYIWSKFIDAYFDKITRETTMEWERVMKSISHRPFHTHTAEYRKFTEKTIEQLKGFSSTFDVSKEIERLEKQIT